MSRFLLFSSVPHCKSFSLDVMHQNTKEWQLCFFTSRLPNRLLINEIDECVRESTYGRWQVYNWKKCNRCTRDLLSMIIDRLLMSLNYFHDASFCFSIGLAKLYVRKKIKQFLIGLLLFLYVCSLNVSTWILLLFTLLTWNRRFICHKWIRTRTEIKDIFTKLDFLVRINVTNDSDIVYLDI